MELYRLRDIILRVLDRPIEEYRWFALLAAIGIYALWGLPTPDNPGGVEVAIGICLLFAIKLVDAPQVLRVRLDQAAWLSIGKVLLIYGLTVPLLIGIMGAQKQHLIMRDVVPFLFMLLPVFCLHRIDSENRAQTLLWAVLFLGIVLAIRACIEYGYGVFGWMFLSPVWAELSYLANAPTILFAALFLPAWGVWQWLERISLHRSICLLAALCATVIAIIPIILSAQRASVGYAILFALPLLGLALYYYPKRLIPLLVALTVLCIPFYDHMSDIWGMLLQKNKLVGLNMRYEEALAVWSVVGESPLSILFGKGWGATFESPAVGGLPVNFTHSFWTSTLLKAGLVGCIISAGYFLFLLKNLWPVLRVHPVLALALLGPMAIDLVLYASFKSLDFGIILLLTSVAGRVAKPS